jgi:mismatch-specific thymine-DNA glycosylase
LSASIRHPLLLTGHHFAGFSNRFWTLLFESGLVPERITYSDDDRLPEFGYGITNIVPRPTPGIDTIERHEYPAAGCGCGARSCATVRRLSRWSA